jgi:hypothetical protein
MKFSERLLLMPQSQHSTLNIIGSLPADFIITGDAQILSRPSRSTLSFQVLGSGSATITKTAEPFSNNAFSGSLKQVETLWQKSSAKSTSKPIHYQTMLNAQELLRDLSFHYSDIPEVEGYPDGEICFDWSTDKGTLSVLVDEKNVYWYAKSRNGKRRKGSDSWDSTVPREILNLLGNL